MQFATRLLTLSATIAQALALVQLTNTNWDVTEGTAFDIEWTGADGAVTLLLKDGPSKNLATVATIGSGLTGDSYTWTPSGIPSGTYAIEIDDSSNTNYGLQFAYSGTGTATTSAATTATTSSESTTSTTDSASTTESTSTSESSSAATTLTTSTATGSANSTSTASSTKASSTKSSSTSGTSSSSSATNTPLNTNDSQKMGSPLALVLLTVAALMLCH